MKLRCGQYELDLSKPCVMGILNVTPDSFSDGGSYANIDAALSQAKKMQSQGAAIIDVGGESTRPGADEVEVDEELARVIPVIEILSSELDVPISIDTSKPAVMYEAVHAGASLINDVYALRNETALETAAQLNRDKNIAICLMHMQGEPRTMQSKPVYQDVVAEVRDFLLERKSICMSLGIKPDQIVLDPGFGFGKTLEHNLQLFRALPRLMQDDQFWLIGVSRKSMIGQITGKTVSERLAGSICLSTLAAQSGAQILRVHDVSETLDALKIVQALKTKH